MNELQIRAILAGVAWGIWPLVMNRSGLSGNISSAAFAAVALLGTLPFAAFALRDMGGPLAHANWTLVVVSGLLGAACMLLFNGMLAKAAPQNVGMLFVVMIVAQTAIPALYQTIMDGHLTASRMVGFAAAFVAAFFLTR